MTKKILLLSTICLLLSAGFVFANPTGPGTTNPTGPGTSNPTSDTKIVLDNPFKVGNDLYTLMEYLVKEVIIKIGGILCVLAFIYSGFLYVTAGGNPTKITKANNALLYSAIGTAVLLGAWVIALVIQNTIGALLP